MIEKSEKLLEKWVNFKSEKYANSYFSSFEAEELLEFFNELEKEGYFVLEIGKVKEIVKWGKKSWLEDSDRYIDIQIFYTEEKELDIEGYEMVEWKKIKIAEFNYDVSLGNISLEYLRNVIEFDYCGELTEGRRFYQCGKYYYEYYDATILYSEITAKMLRWSTKS